MIKLNPPRTLRFFRNRRRRHFNLRIQQLEHALPRRHRRLQNVVFLAQILNRPEEALRVLHERHQHAERHRNLHQMELAFLYGQAGDAHVPDDFSSAEPDDAGHRDRRQHFDHRVIHRIGQDGVFERLHVRSVDVGEFMESAFLAIEKLQDQHPRDRFLQIRVDAGNGRADAPVGIAHLVAENLGRVHDQRQHGECDQRQLPVRVHHDGDNAGQHEHVLENISFSASTSVVTRVTNRPTGFLSKKPTWICCK